MTTITARVQEARAALQKGAGTSAILKMLGTIVKPGTKQDVFMIGSEPVDRRAVNRSTNHEQGSQ